VVPVRGCVASALFASRSVSDGVPRSADALIAKGLSCVYETHEHLSFNQAMEHAFAVVASKQSPELVEPKSFKQAMSGPDADKWYEACMAEMQAHFENGTWQLVQLPAGRKAIGSKWVFKIKRNADGSVECFKARLVAQGFSQRPGVDFTETFAPTTKWAALRTVFALAAIEDMEMESIDISNAYLNGVLKDVDVYMRQPEGFESGSPGDVAHLDKGLYGLKQGGRCWFDKLDDELHVSASLLPWIVRFQRGVVDPKRSRFD
jgi:hypothetical protein